jgi:protein-S-isoprenylcysteine O-methyltransferase Ste14
MPRHGFLILAAGWLFWLAPFLRLKRSGQKPVEKDRRARWGVLLQAVSYAVVWANPWVTRDPGPLRFSFATLFFLIGCLLSWTSVLTLGKQWRIEAGLNADHELVRSGAYATVRHPIYASMLAMFLATSLVVALWVPFVIGLVCFIVGIEIRVRVEDQLLSARFGRDFDAYRAQVAAYLPGIR